MADSMSLGVTPCFLDTIREAQVRWEKELEKRRADLIDFLTKEQRMELAQMLTAPFRNQPSIRDLYPVTPITEEELENLRTNGSKVVFLDFSK